MTAGFRSLSPEAADSARAIGRAFVFSSEQKRLVAEIMTPVLERWAIEQALPTQKMEIAR